MKNILSSISQSEKNRILEMHKKATNKLYLFERELPTEFSLDISGYGETGTLNLTNVVVDKIDMGSGTECYVKFNFTVAKGLEKSWIGRGEETSGQGEFLCSGGNEGKLNKIQLQIKAGGGVMIYDPVGYTQGSILSNWCSTCRNEPEPGTYNSKL